MKYFFGFLAAVALLVLVFILIMRGFSGRGNQTQTQLTDYAATQTVMRMIIDGPVVADENHRSITVTIGRDTNTATLMKGYQGQVIDSKSYGNNENAYTTFLRALELQGYSKGDADPKLSNSSGFCPNGQVYTFEIVTGSDVVQQFWTSSCGGGTFKGKASTIRGLFRDQIPDYSTLTRGTDIH
jgi:hypothetical protein